MDIQLDSFVKKVVRRLSSIYHLEEEYWLGKKIIKDSLNAPPDFMIIGAAKAGTTSLFQYLAQHPEIIPSKKKELLYFSGKGKSLRQYLQNFPLKKEKLNRLTFEASPSYLYSKDALKRIKRILPDIKLIVILRNPVDRSFSQWAFHHDSLFIKEKPWLKDERSFSEAIKAELHSLTLPSPSFQYITRSLYLQHLKLLYQSFSPKQILCLDFELFKTDTKSVLKEVTTFLNVRHTFDSFNISNEKMGGLLETSDKRNSRSLKIYNISNYRENIDASTKKFLCDFFKPYDREIEQLTGKKFGWML